MTWLVVCYVLLDARPPVWSELAWQPFSARWQARAMIAQFEGYRDVRCTVTPWHR